MEMVTNIRKEFNEILNTASWMDATTRKAALAKLSAMDTHIGYPDELMDDKKLIDYYQGLTIDDNNHLENILNIKKFQHDKDFGKLRDPVNRTVWFNHAESAVSNAYYSPIENSIQFPAAILQGKYFSADRPKYMNYGAIGFVFGHEITHGFDGNLINWFNNDHILIKYLNLILDQGRQFDLNGNLVDWWQEETKTAFLAKAKCIIEQYGNYTEPNVHLKLNGIKTQGENIADNGGIKKAYLAYKKLVEAQGDEPKLPGLDYSSKQLFWISAAQIWCEKTTPGKF